MQNTESSVQSLSIVNRAGQRTHNNPDPRFRVQETFNHLLLLEIYVPQSATRLIGDIGFELTSVLGTSVIKPDPLKGHVLLLIAQEPCLGRMCREEEPRRD